MIYDNRLIGWAYQRSSVSIQNLLVSAYGFLRVLERWSPTWRRIQSELEQTESWSASELQALQEERLRKIIRHAYENVPYYRRVFDERRLKPSDINTALDLYKLPVLTKQDVRRFASELCARNVPRWQFRLGRTGGTTGIPLVLAIDKQRIVFDHVLIHRHWSWAGYRPGDRVLVLRGFTLIPADQESGPHWRFDWLDKRMYLSGFHLSANNMQGYVEKLQQWRPELVAGYPSNLFTLARFMERARVKLPTRAVFTSSEVLTPTERGVIEDRFQCKVWDRYGTGERLVAGQECEHGRYHQNVEFGVLQVDWPRGEPAGEGQKGELIHTGLTNFSMPLVRYASEDVGFLQKDDCPCGRKLPLMGAVDGRKDDVIVTADHRLMPRAGLDQIHEFVPNIERCQLVQEEVGRITVRVQPRPAFNDSDKEELVSQLRKRLGRGTEIQIQIFEHLDLSPTGKERFIISQVDINRLTGLELESHRVGNSN
jgi:phenylacetate-CoA ligase